MVIGNLRDLLNWPDREDPYKGLPVNPRTEKKKKEKSKRKRGVKPNPQPQPAGG